MPNVIKDWFNASSSNDGTCVDVRFLDDGTVQARNSTAPDAVNTYTRPEWETFVYGVKIGKFDWPSA